tara:strand:+ start:988 stop:1590 length:603 start_codon:yes stop_codon:yes gene_type:complete
MDGAALMIYIDIQHIGKPNKPDDMGAGFGDEVWQAEAYWTTLYAFHMEMQLRSMGYPVMRLCDGRYSARHERVNRYENDYPQEQASVYVSCHINAGGGSYGAMFYDHRSSLGPRLASAIASEMDLPGISTVKVLPAGPADWTRNAYATIKHVRRPVSICLEPFFIDNPDHQQYMAMDKINLVGEAIANGIHSWYNARQGE